jgi:hemerythrin-like domain-containing protein
MKATQVLMDEHRVIERMISILVKASDGIEAGENIPPSLFLDAADFIRGFADGCHHRKEEGVLFKAMQSAGVPVNAGPIAVMLMEHDLGRTHARGILSGAQKMAGGENSGKAELLQSARNYAQLLTQHIQKEDSILFPMADRVIPLSLHDQVFEDFEKVEHEETGEGIHEKYLELLDRLDILLKDILEKN